MMMNDDEKRKDVLAIEGFNNGIRIGQELDAGL